MPTTPLHALRALAAAALLCTGAAQAQLDTVLIAGGLTQPLFATAPLADGRTFIVEKGGTIKVAQGGVASTFLTVPVDTLGERGLLGMAFDPNYAANQRFFVNYIDPTTFATVIARYETRATPVETAATRTEVLRFAQPVEGYTNHKGGWLAFKPGDANNLYIATGDGGSGNDPQNRAQDTSVLLGKMLRINVNEDDFAADPNVNYGISNDNPFVGQAGVREEIYAVGLRNPFRNSFDRANGNFWIADVGQDTREEVNFIAAANAGGQNFGWRAREGSGDNPGVGDPDQPGVFTGPLFDYEHTTGNQSITGGYVVREAGSPLFGRYVFGDFVSGRIYSIDASLANPTFADATELSFNGLGSLAFRLSSFGEGANGELFIVDIAGNVVQVVPEPGTALLLAGGVLALGLRRLSTASR